MRLRYCCCIYVTLALGVYLVGKTNGRPSNAEAKNHGRHHVEGQLGEEPKLTKQEWKQLHQFEDALKDEEGKLFYTDSWGVQLANLAEVEVADKIAAKHGFVNLGQVASVL